MIKFNYRQVGQVGMIIHGASSSLFEGPSSDSVHDSIVAIDALLMLYSIREQSTFAIVYSLAMKERLHKYSMLGK
jgi:hypothetical protein